MRIRIFWLFFAVLTFGFAIALCFACYDQWQIYYKGSIVPATIISVPGSLSRHGTMEVRFDGKRYFKSTSGNTEYNHVGDTLWMRYLKGHDNLLFINEDPSGFIVLVGFILFLGICCVYYAVRKQALE